MEFKERSGYLVEVSPQCDYKKNIVLIMNFINKL